MMKKIFSLMRIKSTYKKGTVFLWFLSVLGTLYFFVHKACCGGFILLFINSFVTWFHVMMNLGGRKKREEYRGIRLVAFLGYFASFLIGGYVYDVIKEAGDSAIIKYVTVLNLLPTLWLCFNLFTDFEGDLDTD